MHDLRPYDRDRDLDAITRIWREVGWIDSPEGDAALATFLEGTNIEVALLDGAAECAVTWTPGTYRYQHTDLSMCAVSAVTTSRIARKHGFATIMTARAIKAAADAGAAIAALGMFEQGFYDRLGFGTMAYDHDIGFDPSSLTVDHIAYRQPVRLTADDHQEMHDLMGRRLRGHGAVTINSVPGLHAELELLSNPFGLGYRNDEGRLTHFVYGETNEPAHGPYAIKLIGYEETDGLFELLRLLKELSDQITTVRMMQPPEVQFQDLIAGPVTQRRRTRASEHATGIAAAAWMQARVLDLEAVVGARSWGGPEVRFNATITDPVTQILTKGGVEASATDWTGVGGDYVITIGNTSSAEKGTDRELATVRASINALSRCLFGVRSASNLSLTDDLVGPADLLAELDEALRLPPPLPGMEF